MATQGYQHRVRRYRYRANRSTQRVSPICGLPRKVYRAACQGNFNPWWLRKGVYECDGLTMPIDLVRAEMADGRAWR